MDGTRISSQIGILSLTALLWVGCSSVEVGYEPVPFELYDSPLIAGGTPKTEATPHIEPAERSSAKASVDTKSVATDAPTPAVEEKEAAQPEDAGKAARAPEEKDDQNDSTFPVCRISASLLGSVRSIRVFIP